jgi:membrane protein YdbS with pleckstrin-like domain
MMSKTIKKSLGENEKVLKYFSLCDRYLKVKITASLLKWLFIILLIAIAVYLLDYFQIFSSPGINNSSFGYESKNYDQGMSSFVSRIWIALGLAFLLLITPIIVLYNLFYLKISNEFVFTEKRILVKRGWLTTRVKSIYYGRITNTSIRQSFIERFIKSGSLFISTAGSEGYEAKLLHVGRPYELKRDLYNAKVNYKQRTQGEQGSFEKINEEAENDGS